LADVQLRGTPVAGPLAVGPEGVWDRCVARRQTGKTLAKNKGVPGTGRYQTTIQVTGNAMNAFIGKHAAEITGTLSCFDRVLIKGYLRCSPLSRQKSGELKVSPSPC